MKCPELLSLVTPDPTLEEEKGSDAFECFLGSCKLSILTFVKANQTAARQFLCDLASGHAAAMSEYETKHGSTCMLLGAHVYV